MTAKGSSFCPVCGHSRAVHDQSGCVAGWRENFGAAGCTCHLTFPAEPQARHIFQVTVTGGYDRAPARRWLTNQLAALADDNYTATITEPEQL